MTWLKKIGWWLLVAVTAGLALYLKGRAAGKADEELRGIRREREGVQAELGQDQAGLEEATRKVEEAKRDEAAHAAEREEERDALVQEMETDPSGAAELERLRRVRERTRRRRAEDPS